jgi:hypothetical protein
MKKYFPILILMACIAAFAFGLVELFELRFESGDVYPPYSSLRADPLGTMAFYESLEKIPGINVSRDFQAFNRLPEEPQTVYLHLAGDRYEWNLIDKDLFHEIQNFLARGGRLVVTFLPENEEPLFRFNGFETNSVKSATNNVAPAKTNKVDKLKNKKKNSPDDNEYWTHLNDVWSVHTDFRKPESDNGIYQPATVLNKSDFQLPRTLEWHSAIVFTNCDRAWKTIYARGTNAVVVERKFGDGSVVMATDSYFISNEAMTKDRHADLLAWLIGGNKNIVFDEAHFGIVETSGVAVLMRKYRLHGLAAGLLLLAGLFIWKNATSLVPPHAEEQREEFVAGKDSQAGFVNLLRRNIAPRDLLAACFGEWKKAGANKGKISSARIQQAEAIFNSENALPGNNQNPIETYKRISETLGTLSKKL